MPLIPKDWFEQIFSEVNGSSFNRDEIPDHFSVTFMDGDQEVAQWDLTEELKQNGIPQIHFKNSTMNVDAQFLFMHEDLVEELAGNELLQNVIDKARSQFEELGLSANYSIDYALPENYYSMMLAQAIFTLLIGLIGLIVKYNNKTVRLTVVKATGFINSIWCIVTGMLILAEEISKQQFNIHIKTSEFFLPAVLSVLLKVLLISFKLFTVVIYMFQNTMIYRPFFFRRHKKALSRWVLRVSAGQSAGVSTALIAWSVVLIFNHEDGDCLQMLHQTREWQLSLQYLMWGGYLCSLLLSLFFTIGFYRESAKKIGISERKSSKKTMIACSIEILFDASALIANMVQRIQCVSLTAFFEVQGNIAGHCDFTARLHALDGRISACILKLLILQPILQESFVLLAEIVDYCSK
ncbi:hypothetical protein ACHWQZ_G011138 [Mnemiopsis leidyi]